MSGIATIEDIDGELRIERDRLRAKERDIEKRIEEKTQIHIRIANLENHKHRLLELQGVKHENRTPKKI